MGEDATIETEVGELRAECDALKSLLDELRTAYQAGLVGYMAELLGRSADGVVWLPAPWHYGQFTDPEVVLIDGIAPPTKWQPEPDPLSR